jgi:adenosine/AMP kinase
MAGSVSLEIVTVDKPADMNVIIGQAHFIKTVEDLHEELGPGDQGRTLLAFRHPAG